jgi:hypothetical protein
VRDLGARAHHDEHALGLRVADVLAQPVAAAGARAELVHRRLHDAGAGLVVEVGRLARLEEGVGVGGRAAQHGAIGRQPARAVLDEARLVDERRQVGVSERLDAPLLVARAEAVEEVQEGHARAQRGGVGHEGQVLGLLRAARAEQREAGAAAGHHVAVVAEDRQGVRRQRTRRDVHAEGVQLARDLVHVGQHEQQALAGREGRGQRAALQRAVHRAGRAALGLHLDHVGDLAPQVRAPSRRPLVAQLGHRRGGRDRVDRDDLADPVRHARDGLVRVDHDRARGPRILDRGSCEHLGLGHRCLLRGIRPAACSGC